MVRFIVSDADLLAVQALRAAAQSDGVEEAAVKSVLDGGDTDTNARVSADLKGIEVGFFKELANYAIKILEKVNLDKNDKGYKDPELKDVSFV